MGRKIISLKLEKIKRNLRKYTSEIAKNSDLRISSQNSYLQAEYPELFHGLSQEDAKIKEIIIECKIQSFNLNLEKLYKNLKTNSAKFRIVGITNLYFNGLNPVFCLYNELEKTLFKLNKNHIRHKWIFDIFRNKTFTSEIIQSIEYDLERISEFLKDQDRDSLVNQDKIIKLNHFKIKLLNCKEIFSKFNS